MNRLHPSLGPDSTLAGLALILALAATVLFPALGSAPFERAEIYFMDGARSMVESGDHLVPYYKGEPFFDKPPLTYWLMALSFRLFGFFPWAGRLVPALATLGVLLATVWLGWTLLGRRSALAGGLVLATTVAFVAFGRVAMSDMLLVLFTTLAMSLAAAGFAPAGPRWMVPALGAVLGLGFLTKGPVALLLPGFGVALVLWERRKLKPLPPRLALSGALAFAVFGLGWFVLVWARLGWGPLEYFFLHENLERFAGATYDARHPPWYYLVTYLAEGLPWSALLPLALARLAIRKWDAAGRRGAVLLLAWVGLMALPLSLSRGKIDYYLLPLYPPLALIIGNDLAGAPWGRLARLWARVLLTLVALGLLSLAVLPVPLPEPWLPSTVVQWLARGVVTAAAAAALVVALRFTRRRMVGLLAVASVAVFVVVVGVFLPAFRQAQPNAAIVDDVARESRHRPDARVLVCRGAARAHRDILFHARLPVTERCDVWNFASSGFPYMILADARQRTSLQDVRGMREVATYEYVPATALTLKGLLRYPEARPLTLLANYKTKDPVARRKFLKQRKRDLRRLELRAEAEPETPEAVGYARGMARALQSKTSRRRFLRLALGSVAGLAAGYTVGVQRYLFQVNQNDLTISGHTHGGQVVPFLGAPVLPVLNKRFASGLVTTPRTRVFISRGIGWTLLPVRLNCPPEIAVLQLRCAESS